VIKEGRPHGETVWDGRDGFNRVRNEAAILNKLAEITPRIPLVYDLFDAECKTYLVLEKIEGIVLEKVLQKSIKPLPIDMIVHISRELAGFVSDIHAAGIVWRDCKPANLIIEKSGRLRAIDFEGACGVSEFDPLAWSTPVFAPPEVSTGMYLVERQSNLPEDLFALGSCLYLLFEGKLPFRNQNFSKLSSMRRCATKKLKNAVRKLLSFEPDERPQAIEIYRILSDSVQ
jgi:serine/threonine protein kinase